jgi:pseudaminic acid synthase
MPSEPATTPLKIGDRPVGPGCPAFIIAELSCNHRQDYSLAQRTLEAIAEAGADAVKLQTSRPEAITIDCGAEPFVIKGNTPWDGRTLYDLYRETYTPWEWHEPLQTRARELGLAFLASPFDCEAVGFLNALGVPAFKIASFEITDSEIIRACARTGKPILISTGIANETMIAEAIEWCRQAGNNQVILLKCTSAYPAPLEKANLLEMQTLGKRFNCRVGLSDHTLGEIAACTAVALGACIIEKHFILARSLGGPDAPFSMEPDEFADMVRNIRDVETSLGSPTIQEDETKIRGRQFARSLFVVEDIPASAPFTRDNVRSIRPGIGIAPKHLPEILGRHARVDIQRGTPLKWEHIL